MSTRSRPARVPDEMADAFITASRALVGIAVRSINAAPVEITLTQHRLLVLLATGGDQMVGTLAEQLHVNASNASRLCDRLQRLGLLTRTRSRSDGRAVEVSLTPEGGELLEKVRRHRRTEVQHILGQMRTADVQLTVQVMAAFGEAAREAGEDEWAGHSL